MGCLLQCCQNLIARTERLLRAAPVLEPEHHEIESFAARFPYAETEDQATAISDVAEDLAQVEYFHILFDRHQVITTNGAETESLYTGPEALKSLGPAARDEILTIFPELRDLGFVPDMARPCPSGRHARKLAARHIRNHKPLVA